METKTAKMRVNISLEFIRWQQTQLQVNAKVAIQLDKVVIVLCSKLFVLN